MMWYAVLVCCLVSKAEFEQKNKHGESPMVLLGLSVWTVLSVELKAADEAGAP